MAGQIALVGGDEFRPGCEIMDSYLLEITGPKAASVLIVPTAALDGPARAASNGVRHFSRLGAEASELMVLDGRDANDEALVGKIGQATHVYFTGGDPNHLLNTLKGSLLLQRLQEWSGEGGILVGSSAGAMVMGSSMRRPREGLWTDGLGLTEGLAVFPHHEHSDPAAVAETLEESVPRGIKVLGIDARTCCVGSPGDWKVVGVGKVTGYWNGQWQSFSSGESLPSEF